MITNQKYFLRFENQMKGVYTGDSKKTFAEALILAKGIVSAFDKSVEIIKTTGKGSTWKLRHIATIKQGRA